MAKKEKPADPHAHKIPKNKLVKPKRIILTRFKIHANIGGYSAGSEIRLRCRKRDGLPVERYWRRRLHDAKTDGCIVKVPDPPKKKKEVQEPE